MEREGEGGRQRGFFVSFGYTKDAERECAAFHKRTSRIINLLTAQEILNEEHVQKMYRWPRSNDAPVCFPANSFSELIMAFKTSIWLADGQTLKAQERVALDSEKRLEDWIVADLTLLGENLLLLGRQIHTTGGPLDILAIDGEGVLVVAELKRNRTPREVVAQVLDYASWVRGQTPPDFDNLCHTKHGKSLADYFQAHFKSKLPDSACKSHRMIVVAAELDDLSERILKYLQDEHGIDINAVFFSVYNVRGKEILSRAWLAEQDTTKESKSKRASRGYDVFSKLLNAPISRDALGAEMVKAGFTLSTASSYISWAKRVVDEKHMNPFYFEAESYKGDDGVVMLRRKPGQDFTHEDPLGEKPVSAWVGR
jgi:hypothetical protein